MANRDDIQLLQRIYDSSLLLHDGDRDKTLRWLCARNEYFLDRTPLSVFHDGEGCFLLRWLEARI